MQSVKLPAEFVIEFDVAGSATVFHKTPQSTPCSLSEVLMRHSGAPYTTVITVNGGTAIPMLDFHCKRMLIAMEQLYPKLAPLELSNLRTSLIWLISQVTQLRASGTGELQIVPMLVLQSDKLFLTVHASDIPNPTTNIVAVSVECRGAPRINPHVKNTAWATQRKPLESARMSEISETILVDIDDDGFHSLLEGLVSNFFVVTQNLEIWTAPSHLVLPGSLRECVLAACDVLGAQVKYRPVRLADFRQFEAAFLTNARIYLHPIRSIHVPDPDIASDCPRQIDLPNGPAATELVDRLRSVVCRLLTQSATRTIPFTSVVQNSA